jgi:hypothetical protein
VIRQGVTIGLAAWVGCAEPPKPDLFLAVFQDDAIRAAPASPIAPEAVSLALAGMSPDDRVRLLGDLARVASEAVKRANPLFVELGEGREASGAGLLSAEALPALTAAANLGTTSWRAPQLTVELGPSCRAGATRCTRLRDPPRDESLERRARALAWALSHAAVLRAHGSPSELARALRLRRGQPGSTLALVFDAPQGTLDGEELQAVRSQATRALRYVPDGSPGRAWIEAIAQAPQRWSLPISVEPGDVWVVPRLGSLARLDDFVAEIKGCGTFECIQGCVKPGP